MYRYYDLAPGNIYHIYTRGVAKQNIFKDSADKRRFLKLLIHCLPVGTIQSLSIAQRLQQPSARTNPGQGIIDLLCYCLMDNHIHLLIQENIKGGSLYMQRILTSYAKYFNTRYDRLGPLYEGRFKATWVDNDEQLLHVSRYIHLNPFVAHLTDNPLAYP